MKGSKLFQMQKCMPVWCRTGTCIILPVACHMAKPLKLPT
ncbi:hypothetical protein R103_H30366 [Saccharomyces cerevisiae R103]|uniref:Putative uncharacterized protein YHR032C-A n=2 Tax=Saccharomyces cerevisiae TaxID=4932 RepID=YH032_YEAST|nr:RecName: Full=Putative uncharacterized protein YHR032C-A [Saccharomyces cerevisiae S288C]AAL79213.1 unknown [Saccharomyces cerevisiae]EWG95652.1 hypothetical protein R103_H30366 [Saccharomyces cerevisiae R103]WNM96949.1 hypothetical protein RMP76_088 [Saccharomyces cerevisiae synthetic construct]CAY80319.1 EC1118_1H23_0056p [Saccharomyces cerevisiae EC1118]KZV10755.1 hypothetical protein WN66_02842 [Saccharomyces cerevisiae]